MRGCLFVGERPGRRSEHGLAAVLNVAADGAVTVGPIPEIAVGRQFAPISRPAGATAADLLAVLLEASARRQGKSD